MHVHNLNLLIIQFRVIFMKVGRSFAVKFNLDTLSRCITDGEKLRNGSCLRTGPRFRVFKNLTPDFVKEKYLHDCI